MRITYIHQHFRTPKDGGATRSWEFATRLARDGHTVTVITGGSPDIQDLPARLRVRRIPTAYTNSMSIGRRLVSFGSFVLRASAVAVSVPVDVVFASSTPLTVAIPARAASAIRRRPYVFEVRDVWPKVPIELGLLRHRALISTAYALERWAYKGAASVIALSKGMADDVRAINPHVPIQIIPNGADIAAFKRSGNEKQLICSRLGWTRPTIIYAGSLGYSYDPAWMVHLAHELRGHDIDLVIYGTGSELNKCRRLAEHYAFDADTLFLGNQPKAAIADATAVSAATLSVVRDNPVMNAASINKIFDSLAAGKPVFTNHGGWMTKLLDSAEAGWQLPRDVRLAAGILAGKINDQIELDRRGRNAAHLASSSFDREDLYLRFVGELKTATSCDVRNPR